MPGELIGITGLLVLLVLIFLGVPIGINLLIVGFLGLLVLIGWDGTSQLLAGRPFAATAVFGFLVLPLFLLMGEFAVHGRIGEDAFNVGSKWIGGFPGGLAMGTTLGCAIFGAVSGSSLAANTMFTKMALPEMRKRNYDVRLATGCIAASGTLACLIPPSSVLILYGMFTNTSIGRILIGGYIPGIVSAAIYMAMMFIRVKLNPKLAPVAPPGASWKEKWGSVRGLWAVMAIVALMLGGIFTGVFTPSEGAAFGALGTLIITIFRKQLSRERLLESLRETARVTGMLFLIIIGASVFTRFMAVSQITAGLEGIVSGLPMIGVVILFCFVMAIMGMFMDAIGMMSITIPIFFPVVTALGVHPVWFGILTVKTLELGGITPPLGLNVYAVKAAVGEAVSIQDIFRGIAPFVLMDILTIALIIAVPSIATWLPSLMWK
jgi:C4-dicarboxylate transporter DctM subunit